LHFSCLAVVLALDCAAKGNGAEFAESGCALDDEPSDGGVVGAGDPLPVCAAIDTMEGGGMWRRC